MKALRILHLEDNAIDAELVKLMLAEDGLEFDAVVAKTRSEYITALEQNDFDLILSDHVIPGFSGRYALDIARQKCPQVPFIFVSGKINQTEATVYLRKGALDYVSKDELWRLAPSARRSVQSIPPPQPDNQQRYISAMEMLVTVVQELSLAHNLETITEIVRKAARELTGADGATFVLRDGDQCYYADENAIRPLWKGKRFPMSICIGGWCMKNQQPIIIEDVYGDSRIPIEAYRPTFIKSLVMVPIRTKSPIGAIGNYWAEKHAATPQEVRLLQALADTTSVAMENVQVYNELEQRVWDRTAQLEAVNRELKTFSYIVSHDLRSPLQSINGFSEVLLKKCANQVDSEGKRYLNHLRTAANRMNVQIEQMLALYKLSQVELKLENVDLSSIAGEILINLQANEPERQVETTIQEGINVHGDPILLRVVLENLLSNAWKYSSKRQQAVIEFGTKQSDTYLYFYIKDNGAGFDMECADKLFSPFQRMHSEAEFPGNGVGLASVQRIIHKHGGRIWAETVVEQGATFYFTLPDAPIQP